MLYLVTLSSSAYSLLAMHGGGARTVAPRMSLNYVAPDSITNAGPRFGDNTYERFASLNDPALAGIGEPAPGVEGLTYTAPDSITTAGPRIGDNTYERRASLNGRA